VAQEDAVVGYGGRGAVAARQRRPHAAREERHGDERPRAVDVGEVPEAAVQVMRGRAPAVVATMHMTRAARRTPR
jgi:hypothetical protein